MLNKSTLNPLLQAEHEIKTTKNKSFSILTTINAPLLSKDPNLAQDPMLKGCRHK
ncbi:hypothetical protein J2W49_003502 [Hydrogenophaga palleronii]|uniref:Uncharacterized protein n=1 Tax=Hydrogenophaga palleronii TaxID=65655 RepID=A0ABU1WQF8_9BURK|nr:hypothetical protein [Hydrogenophaga palleronii]